MNNRTRALAISRGVKARVFERDGGRCVICGRPGNPEAHYISRAHGGLGIEENIVTLCRECHFRYDQTIDRAVYRWAIREYLMDRYPDWDEKKLMFKKGENS